MNEEKIEPTGRHELDPKVMAVLAYFLWLVGGIVFYAQSKNAFVRFHAMQSILFTAFAAVIYVFFMTFGFLLWILLAPVSILTWMLIFGVWIVLMLKAYQGEKFKLPIIGQMAERFIK